MSNFKDLTGQVFGRLTVVERAEDKISKTGNHRVAWLCKCDCGNETIVAGEYLKNGKTQSCGCLSKELASQRWSKDIAGQKFGKLTAIRRISEIGEPVKWECKCDCGNTCVVDRCNLGRSTKSCGCLSHKGTHRLCKTRLYGIWIDMKQRCYNSNSKAYKNYGERGIEICSEWKDDFATFYNWAINNGYEDGLEIDRIDNNQSYSPNNCRWITHQEQQLNKRSNRLVEYNGIIKPLKIWVDELNLDYHKVNIRLLNGWNVEDAFFSDGYEHFKKYHNNKHQKKPVFQYDLEMNFINEYESIIEASEFINANLNGVSRCCHHKQKQYKGYIWRFKDEIERGIV